MLTFNADAIVFEYYTNTETAEQQKAQVLAQLDNGKAARDGKVTGVLAHFFSSAA